MVPCASPSFDGRDIGVGVSRRLVEFAQEETGTNGEKQRALTGVLSPAPGPPRHEPRRNFWYHRSGCHRWHPERWFPNKVRPGALPCGALYSARSNPFVPVLFSVCARFLMQLQWLL